MATVAELIANYIIAAATGTPMWDYQGYFLNYDSRIALVPALMFGLLIFVAICLIQPAIIKLLEKYRSSQIHNISFIVVAVLFFIDLISRIWIGSNI